MSDQVGSDGVSGASAGTAAADDDVSRLHELGYAQELLREMGGFSNFAISFTIISILAGTRTPTNSVWLAAAAAFILGLPYLWSATAYAAVTSIAVIGLYIAYVTPVYLKLRAGDRFQHGKWHLGRWSKPLGWIAVVWVIFIVILFVLPTVSPVSATNFNYSIVAVAVVLFGAGGWYLLSARKWFTGPRVQGSAQELAAAEHELAEVEAALEGRA